MNANEQLQEELISRSIDNELFKKSLIAKILPILNRVSEDIQRELLESEIKEYRKTRIEVLLRNIRLLQAGAYADIQELIDGDLEKLAPVEATYLINAMNGVMGAELTVIPTLEQIYAAAAARPFNGKLLKKWYQNLEVDARERIAQQIRIGYIEGEAVSRIAARIKRSVNTDIARVDTIVRTAVSHISNVATQRVYDANEHLLKGVVWVSTLDTKTTPICIKRDKKQYPLKSGPRPPAHLGCRSRTTPMLKSWRSIDGIPTITRASMDGQVPSSLSYGDWLRRQSVSRQQEVLGIRKAELFRSGKLSVEKFSTRDGRPLTLKELENRHPQAWQKAFGNAA